MEIKREILKLLKEDEEFRYTVAGLIGLAEILKRMDKHEERFVEIIERLDKHEAQLIEIVKRLDKHEERFVEIVNRLDKHEAQLIKLREDMMRGFDLIERRISALGVRWGVMSEEAFREGIKGLLSKELGVKVERWIGRDEDGLVYGYPADVEIDVAIQNERIVLIEVKSHVRASDIVILNKKAQIYQKKTGKKPDRVIIVTPYVDEEAQEVARRLSIEVYTKL
ncbi:MAG: DUF3782 domain-containing protein [Nitrososphaerales archaeon]